MPTKYKKYYASKSEFPTKFIKSNSAQVGHVAARKFLEKKFGITFSKDVRIRTKAGNWCFMEPILKSDKTE